MKREVVTTPVLPVVQTSGLQELSVASIEVGGLNPRQDFDPAGLAELGQSILSVGILQPLIVRRVNSHFELVAGERRLRASRQVGLERVPCLVRELTDLQALEVMVLENLQRQDISALEEGAGFASLIASGSYTADSLAEKLGKSRAHVYSRLRLNKLCPAVKEALAKGTIETSTAELLGKFDGVARQKAALRHLKDSTWGVEPMSFRRAKECLERFFVPLAKAPWRGDKSGYESERFLSECQLSPCAACPRNSANMPDLPGKPVCVDNACYADKLTRYGKWRLAVLRNEGRPVVEVEDRFWDCQGDCSHNSPWARVDQTAYDVKRAKGKEHPTLGQALKGLDCPVHVAVNPRGETVELVKRVEARAALLKAGKLSDPERSGSVKTTEERRQVIADNRLRRSVDARCLLAVQQWAETLSEVDFLAAWFTVSNGVQGGLLLGKDQARRWDHDDGEQFGWVRKNKCGLANLGVCSIRSGVIGLDVGDGPDKNGLQLQYWCQAAGVDRVALEKALVENDKELTPAGAAKLSLAQAKRQAAANSRKARV